MRRGSLSPAALVVLLSAWGPLSSACGNGDSSLHDVTGDAAGGADSPADTQTEGSSGDGAATDAGRDAPADVRTFDAHEDVVLPDVVQPPEDAPGDAGDQDATHMMPADGGFIG